MANRKASIKVNYIFSIAYQLLAIVLPILMTPYVSRKLGVSNVGYYSHVTSIVSYFALCANLGTYTYGRREIGSLQNNKSEYSIAFWNIFSVKTLIGIIVLFSYGIFLGTSPELKELYLIEVFLILAQVFDISWFFQGLENYRITVIFQTILKIIGAVSIFAFVKSPDHLERYTLIMSLLTFGANLCTYPFLLKYLDKPLLSISNIRKHLIGSCLLFVPQVAASLYMSVDKTMIGIFYKDGIQNGLYEQATKIDQLGLHVLIALTGVMIPRLALCYKEKDFITLKSYSHSAIKYIMFLGCPLAFGISGIGYNVLPWFLGSGYEQSSNILHITAFIVIVMGLTNFLGYGYLVATRQQKVYTITVFTGTIVNILMNMMLIPSLGGFGAAIASLASESIVLIFQIIILKDQLDLKNAFKGTFKYMILAIVMGVIVLCLSKTMSATIIHSIIIAVIGIVVYCIPLIVFKDDHIWKIINGGKNIIKKVVGKNGSCIPG